MWGDDLPSDPNDLLDLLDELVAENAPQLHAALIDALGHSAGAVRVYAALLLAEHFHDLRALPGLVEALRGWDQTVQSMAAEAVWEIGDGDPGALIDALHYARGDIRDAIAEALDLVGWLPDDPDSEVSYCIATRKWPELVAMGQEAVPGLIAALGDADGNLRRGAAWALGYIGDAAAVPALASLLDDASGDMFGIGERVCDVAADALTRIGSEEALAIVDWWASGGSAPRAG